MFSFPNRNNGFVSPSRTKWSVNQTESIQLSISTFSWQSNIQEIWGGAIHGHCGSKKLTARTQIWESRIFYFHKCPSSWSDFIFCLQMRGWRLSYFNFQSFVKSVWFHLRMYGNFQPKILKWCIRSHKIAWFSASWLT